MDVEIDKDIRSRSIIFYLLEYDHVTKDASFGVLQMIPTEAGRTPGPTFQIPIDKMELVMNQLWSLGCRPSQGYYEDTRKALEGRIEDLKFCLAQAMQTIREMSPGWKNSGGSDAPH